ncbi:hypothetical protein ETAA8_42320 [Anatilimnocola aggregata]|uniref:Uncharacterized protein n=1 Tax=Anatilimnocola aggregata TaxID=2528021 RepID=A0A517YFV1_9BACT|nr:DUF6340 family protein [Anatilimnocola aggregata]QDU29125.1 hypothetical protein ETAA8_42320 [Anatilimnocola aggregata]
MTFCRCTRLPELGLLLLATLLLASGCAPKARMMVWRPAELDIAGLERLAILDFEGDQQSGKIARSALQSQLFENKYYNLIDQAELARVRPVTTPEGNPDLTAAMEAARTMGVDAILCGQVVSYNVLDDLQTDHHIELGGSTSKSSKGDTSSGVGFGLDSTQTLTREASVSVAAKLIDVRTGEIRAARQFSHTFHGKRVNGQGDLPPREAILTKLLNECSQDVVRMIAPHYLPQEVVLARQYYGKGMNELRAGNKSAMKGNWTEAEKHWQTALRENPQSHAAQFNLALAAEARLDYPAAMQHLDNAIKGYAASDYQAAKKRMTAGQQKFQLAFAQAQSRPTAQAALAARNQPPPMAPNAQFPPQQQFVQQPPQYGPPQQPAAPHNVPPQMPAYGPPPPTGPQVMPASHSQLPPQ